MSEKKEHKGDDHKNHLLKNGELVEVSVSELKEKDTILIKPGEKVPADGIIPKSFELLETRKAI